MSLFLMVMRSGVIVVSRASEQNNDYAASDRSAVSDCRVKRRQNLRSQTAIYKKSDLMSLFLMVMRFCSFPYLRYLKNYKISYNIRQESA